MSDQATTYFYLKMSESPAPVPTPDPGFLPGGNVPQTGDLLGIVFICSLLLLLMFLIFCVINNYRQNRFMKEMKETIRVEMEEQRTAIEKWKRDVDNLIMNNNAANSAVNVSDKTALIDVKNKTKKVK